MSAQKQVTLPNGISGNFTCRIEDVDKRCKPDPVRLAIIRYAWYANQEQKNNNNPIITGSIDLPFEPFMADKRSEDVAYEELQKPGMMLEGSIKV